MNPGDTITIGVTTQVKVNGADNWFKLEVTHAVQEGEDDPHGIVQEYVEQKFTKTVYGLADTIEGMINP